jgi:hypothetical protein
VESSELDVPELLVPLEPIELPVVVAELPWSVELPPIELDPLEPWFNPLDEPTELLPDCDPERLVPAEPEPIVLEPELPELPDEPEPMVLKPELPDEPDEPDEPADPAL